MGIANNQLGAESPATIQQFVQQTGVTFPMLWDQGTYGGFRSAGGGGVSPFPLDVLIRKDGTIAYVNHEYDASALQTLVQNLLSSQ